MNSDNQPSAADRLPPLKLPMKALTADQWRSLLLQRIGMDPDSFKDVQEGRTAWAMVAAIDEEGFEAIIHAIATFGVIEEIGGGNGGGEIARLLSAIDGKASGIPTEPREQSHGNVQSL